jgi:hypothetical protein
MCLQRRFRQVFFGAITQILLEVILCERFPPSTSSEVLSSSVYMLVGKS